MANHCEERKYEVSVSEWPSIKTDQLAMSPSGAETLACSLSDPRAKNSTGSRGLHEQQLKPISPMLRIVRRTS